MKGGFVKIVVAAPRRYATKIRVAAGKAGAGKQGNYDFTSGSIRQIGRFRPLDGATPMIGKLGKLQAVKEERIEVLCERKLYKKIIKAIRKQHPYEEPAIEVYPLIYP